MSGLLARRVDQSPVAPPKHRVFDIMCRITGDKPTRWHPVDFWPTRVRAEVNVAMRRAYATKGGVTDLEYDIRERVL